MNTLYLAAVSTTPSCLCHLIYVYVTCLILWAFYFEICRHINKSLNSVPWMVEHGLWNMSKHIKGSPINFTKI